MRIACWMLILVQLAGCGGGTSDAPAQTIGGDASIDGAPDVSWDNQVSIDQFNGGDASGLGDIIQFLDSHILDAKVVEGSTECIPDGSGILELGSCCNHESCLGQCVETDDAAIICWCLGIVGGCHEGSVCCLYRGGCTDPLLCSP
jgi:hypothetical protein